jgi:hypothetical protein
VTWLFAFFAIRTVRSNVLESEDTSRKGEMTMRSMLAMLLTLGIGITAMTLVAFAQVNVLPSFTNQYGNQIVPLEPADGSGGLVAEADGGCYKDGVVYSCSPPAPMTMPTPSGSGGSVAGGSTVCPLIGPCYEPRNQF